MNDIDKLKSEGIFFIDDQKLFMSITSTNGKLGVDHYGNIIEINKSDNQRNILIAGLATGGKNNNISINSIKPLIRSNDDFMELNKYYLTFAFGHPYYNENNIGYLIGNSWKKFIEIKKFNIIDIENNTILVLQGKNTIGVINKSCNLKGIIVRHGAILLIDDENIEIKTEFILIESGGLFQAGSTHDNKYKFTKKLKIILTNNKYGYKNSGVITSQYSYIVYNPGITLYKEAYTYVLSLIKLFSEQTILKNIKYDADLIFFVSDDNITLAQLKDNILSMSPSSYTGDSYNNFCNSFGAKVIGVGFNGNYHLCGSVSSDHTYTGTWNAHEISNNQGNKTTFPYINEYDLLTFNDEKSKAFSNIANIETEYPMTWCNIDNDYYSKGSNIIKIDNKYINNCFEEWKHDSQIVITCKTNKFTSEKDWLGMIPIWIDNNDDCNINANENANRKFLLEKYLRRTRNDTIDNDIILPDNEDDFDYTGVEVVKIDKLIYKDNKFTGEILLKNPLKFNHNSRKTNLLDINNK